jgi:hypothetical protein
VRIDFEFRACLYVRTLYAFRLILGIRVNSSGASPDSALLLGFIGRKKPESLSLRRFAPQPLARTIAAAAHFPITIIMVVPGEFGWHCLRGAFQA